MPTVWLGALYPGTFDEPEEARTETFPSNDFRFALPSSVAKLRANSRPLWNSYILKDT
jgi:hypothetical protein